MTTRWRILSFGSAGALVIAGVLFAVLLGGGAGGMLALVLVGVGFVVATGLVFLEVGLSEDRQLEREVRRDHPAPIRRPPSRSGAAVQGRARRLKLDRSRGQRRRLG